MANARRLGRVDDRFSGLFDVEVDVVRYAY